VNKADLTMGRRLFQPLAFLAIFARNKDILFHGE
tara:strand:- start:129 stop:230 length:102 start_codon:yes stop_codon:yes gene_type:complete